MLEIGAGSGYAAAVMGRIAKEVIAIERHADLAGLADARMKELGYSNVSIRKGDGTGGAPDLAPFDAIVASASGSHLPEILLEQLDIGGRLVMPLGEPRDLQKLVKLRRIGPNDYERQDLGQVRFVPLIGAHGWKEGRGGE